MRTPSNLAIKADPFAGTSLEGQASPVRGSGGGAHSSPPVTEASAAAMGAAVAASGSGSDGGSSGGGVGVEPQKQKPAQTKFLPGARMFVNVFE
jgi:hypothetical protein